MTPMSAILPEGKGIQRDSSLPRQEDLPAHALSHSGSGKVIDVVGALSPRSTSESPNRSLTPRTAYTPVFSPRSLVARPGSSPGRQASPLRPSAGQVVQTIVSY